jgi:CheY-like chemotaxis protein
VDDEEIMRITAKSILKECGYDVLIAKDGEEAIAIFKELRKEIDVVFLDMAMPNMSGKEVYEELKKIDPRVKVLLASGFRQDRRVEEVMEMGVNGFIHKPYSMADLAKKIQEVLK